MSIPPRARFNALLLAQFGGAIIIASGMLCYWFDWRGAAVPPDRLIKARSVAVAITIFAMAFFPLLGSVGFNGMVWGLARKAVGKGAKKRVPLADRPGFVRCTVWTYCFVNLFFLTYLVHMTGGLAGSMFSGVYLVIPAIALILVDDVLDVWIVLGLILCAAGGIFLAFLMDIWPHLDNFTASAFPKAFDISLLLVSGEAMLIPLGQIGILFIQLRNEAEGQETANTP
jgi:hypothetical protein